MSQSLRQATLVGKASGSNAAIAAPRQKVLVVSMHLPPENVPCTVQAGQFMECLREAGIETFGLSISLSPFSGVLESTPDILRVPEDRESLRRRLRFEHLSEYFFRRGEYGNAWTPFAIEAAERIVESEGITGILTVSPPVASHNVGLHLKRKYPHLTWVADFQDPYVDNPFRESNFIWDRVVRWRERAIFDAADGLIANTSTVQDVWLERYPRHRGKIDVIWTGFDANETIAASPAALPARRVLAHVGSIYGSRTPVPLLESIDRLAASGRLKKGDIELLFVGETDTNYSQTAQFLRLESEGWVRCEPKVSRVESLDIAAAADFLLVLDLNARDLSLQVPSKLFDYIRIGRPILCFTAADSPSERILARSGVPHVCIRRGWDIEELDNSLLRFLSLSSERVQPDEWFNSTFEIRRQIPRLLTFFGQRDDSAAE